MRKPKLVVLLALFALAPFALAACGGDDDNDNDVAAPPTDPQADTTVQVSAPADGSLAFDQDSLEAPAGTVTFEFDNPSAVPHDFVIDDADGNDIARTEVVIDDSDSVTVDLEPGEYTFYCSVPGHREAGQEGVLTVE